MVEALEWAADYAERNKLFDTPMKSNGYPMDGHKPPTPAEKADIILKLARNATDDGPRPEIKFLRSVQQNLTEAQIESNTLTDAMAHIESIRRVVSKYLEGK
jgi:hypothetical protein